MKHIIIITSACVLVFLIVMVGGLYVVKSQEQPSGLDLEGYDKEVERFNNVLANASDEELFLILRFAIYKGYVPTGDIDPYHYVYAGVTSRHRTKEIYDTLEERDRYDLLAQLYPDQKALHDYVHAAAVRFEAHDQDTTQMNFLEKNRYTRGRKLYVIHETMMQTLAPDSLLFESIGDLPRTTLYNKYFGIQFLKRY